MFFVNMLYQFFTNFSLGTEHKWFCIYRNYITITQQNVQQPQLTYLTPEINKINFVDHKSNSFFFNKMVRLYNCLHRCEFINLHV